MLDKQSIINLAFLKLGEQTQLYHSNITDTMGIADQLFDEVIDGLATDATFMFNAKTVRLTKNSNEKNLFDEFRYNKPNDYLSKVYCSDRAIRTESEFLYSKENEVDLCYCFTMPLSDYPMYIKPLVIAKLAKRIAETYDGHYAKIPMLEKEILDETNKIVGQEGIPFAMNLER